LLHDGAFGLGKLSALHGTCQLSRNPVRLSFIPYNGVTLNIFARAHADGTLASAVSEKAKLEDSTKGLVG